MVSSSLYKDVAASERLLRESLKNGAPCIPDDPLRLSLLEKALHYTSSYPADSASKKTEEVLWKPCFYKCIESFRRSIRKYAAASNGDRRVREHFFQVSLQFQSFLDSASAYYEKLHDAFAAGPSSDAVLQSMFRCLIFLGDIARYRELHSQKAKKNFAAAESYYHRALAVMPENGNPHNQLAVLATYVEAETIAVYRYCRSLLVPQPFATAAENLALLFERARQRPLPSHLPPITSTSSPKDKSAFLKSFLHRLTRLHGHFLSPGNDAMDPTTYPLDLEDAVGDDYKLLLSAGVIGDALLLKLCAINMHCLHTSVGPMRAHALRLALLLLTTTLEYVDENRDKTALLGPVSVMADYLQPRLELLASVETAPFLASLTRVLNSLCLDHEDPDALTWKPRLKEMHELRCFAPLDQSSIGSNELLSEVDARHVRCANLVGFGRRLTEPIGDEERVYLYLHLNQFETSPRWSAASPSNVSMGLLSQHGGFDDDDGNDEEEEDFDDEVIVFQPAAYTQRPPTPPMLASSPSLNSVDLSAFRHLGAGVRASSEASLWGQPTPTTTTSMRVEDDPFWEDLNAVEEEGSRYAHQVSSLSMFFQPDDRRPSPPAARVVTRNPFFVNS
ncbi:hypothetical protein SPRG_04472 [Saprolegnia parasitica CBS 223.65]|uniref:DNA/RNA-binding domain-containing protein n=1 Tax=Saprolegnia parasitica (strain CBS 223.65) TaxID=695850 RepID=A0A067CVM2_SAPPC|nr:hypothetical protein SPRG_04472 [Saprolegnia parasitica CBS 223.65]KDO30571.1 hypothetical protein SPRG_04472 [Saprolegnia parasitica CBS 223.65]|eukprot:XP_012198786.1 hypothetical protein SPRG_04472 [Saprolegnia parasitica CBS 223.65]